MNRLAYAEIPRLFQRYGPTTKYRVMNDFGASSKSVLEAFATLVGEGKVIALGTAHELGIHQQRLRGDAVIYALPGQVHPGTQVVVQAPELPHEQPKKSKGSGVIAGPMTVGRGARWFLNQADVRR